MTAIPLAPGIGWTAYDEHSVWVANGTTGTVTRVDAASSTVVATVKVGPSPWTPTSSTASGPTWSPPTRQGSRLSAIREVACRTVSRLVG